MVNLIQRLCALLSQNKVSAKDKEIAELHEIIKKILPSAERSIDLLIENDELKTRLGKPRPYAGVY